MILSPTSRGAFQGRSAAMHGCPTSRPTSRAAAALCLLSTLVVFLRRVDTRCHCPTPSWEKRLNFEYPVDSMLPQAGHVHVTLTKTYGGGNSSTTADVVAFAPIVYNGSAGVINDPALRIQRY